MYTKTGEKLEKINKSDKNYVILELVKNISKYENKNRSMFIIDNNITVQKK